MLCGCASTRCCGGAERTTTRDVYILGSYAHTSNRWPSGFCANSFRATTPHDATCTPHTTPRYPTMTEKRLTFSQDVITQQTTRRTCLTSPRARRTIVSPNTACARGRRSTARRRRRPAPAPREAPAPRWTPAALRAGRVVRRRRQDDDEAMDDDEDAADSDDGEPSAAARGASRKPVEWASRQQLIDAARASPRRSRSSSRTR